MPSFGLFFFYIIMRKKHILTYAEWIVSEVPKFTRKKLEMYIRDYSRKYEQAKKDGLNVKLCKKMLDDLIREQKDRQQNKRGGY